MVRYVSILIIVVVTLMSLLSYDHIFLNRMSTSSAPVDNTVNDNLLTLATMHTLLNYSTLYINTTPVSVKVYSDRSVFNDSVGIPQLQSDHFYSYSEFSDMTGECTVHYLVSADVSEFLLMVRENRFCYYMRDLDK